MTYAVTICRLIKFTLGAEMQQFNWTRHAMFVAASAFWLLPGHFRLSPNTAGPIDVTSLLMLSLAWLVCYADSTKLSQNSLIRLQRGFTLTFLAIAGVTLAIHLCTPTQGLKGKYYANVDFQPPIESSWKFRTEEFTRIDPQLDFTSAGFSFTKQYFPLYFSNNWYLREWKANSDNATSGYLFSAEWNGRINLPSDVTALVVRAAAGEAALTFDGIEYRDGEASGLTSGPHSIHVRYARNSEEPPSLSLQWLKDGQWTAVPSYAFSINVWAEFLTNVQFGILLCWLALLGHLAWRKKASILTYRTFLWLLFVSLVAKSALDIADHGKNFDFQIFVPGNDWLLYETFSRDILQGNWLSTLEMPFITMNFGYRYILSLLHLVAGEAPVDVMLLQIASMALLITVAAGLIAKHWGMAVSLLFTVIVLWSNQVMKFAEPLLDTTFAVIAGMLVLYGLIRFADKASRNWLVFAGLSLGMGVLLRANFLPFLAVAALWVWLVHPGRHWQNKATDIAILIALVIGLMSLIGLRNQIVAGEWRWLPANGLPNLWVGNHPPEFNGPTYFAVKWQPAEHDILQHVIRYIYSDPLAFVRRIFDKSLYVFGVEQQTVYNFSADAKEGFKVKTKVLLPWVLAIVGTVTLWMRPHLLQRRELTLLWAWITIVNLPLAILFFPWGYGWRLSGPSFLPLYLIGAVALYQWYVASNRLWTEKYGRRKWRNELYNQQ